MSTLELPEEMMTATELSEWMARQGLLGQGTVEQRRKAATVIEAYARVFHLHESKKEKK